MCNDPRDINRVNAKFVEDVQGETITDYWEISHSSPYFEGSLPHIILVATRVINAGEEIFTEYGQEYWDQKEIRHRSITAE